MPPDLILRLATPADAPAIAALIERSVHGLQAGDYTRAQREAAIGQVFLVDHGLIADGAYFVVEATGGRLAGAGGWSNRKALHGAHVHGDTGERIDPAIEPARIRAYFVDPDFARRGVGSAILRACEDAARAHGFTRAVLGATLTGVPFYARHGYLEQGREEVALPGGQSLTVVHMGRPLD
jgi:GNAT superfamily N-acetyltransferase